MGRGSKVLVHNDSVMNSATDFSSYFCQKPGCLKRVYMHKPKNIKELLQFGLDSDPSACISSLTLFLCCSYCSNLAMNTNCMLNTFVLHEFSRRSFLRWSKAESCPRADLRSGFLKQLQLQPSSCYQKCNC